MKKQIFISLLIILIITGCISVKKALITNTNSNSNVLAFSKTIFSDNFDDNRNKWIQKNSPDFSVKIKDDHLLIEKFERNRIKNGCLWYEKSIDSLQTASNFSISFDARFVKYDDILNSIDFQWGNLNDDLYQLRFDINGEITFKRFTNHNWIDIVSVQKSNLISTDKFNKIFINQINDRCIIIINNTEVLETKIEKITGNKIGFQDCLKVSWEFDNLIIRI